MRRSVSRAGSPDVLRISDSSPSSAETSFRELDDVFLQTQTRIWLGEVLHTRFDEETTIADLLANGEILFQVSKVVWKMLRTKYIEIKYSKAFVYKPSESGKGGGRYTPYSNVDSFLKICQIMGLTGVDLFSPSDVVEKRDTRRVCMCIRSLSKKARSKHLNVPDFDIVTYTIAMPTDMVGWIRRSLEKSQCSSSRPVICSRCLHSKGKYRQKSQRVDLLSEDSDDAERSYYTPEFRSPASDISFDSEILSGSLRENTPGGDSMDEDNCQTPEHIFHLDVHSQHDDVLNSSHHVAIHLAESAESGNAGRIRDSNYQFTSEYPISSSKLCLECQFGSNVTASCSHWRPFKCLLNSFENGCQADCECCGTCAASVGDSLNQLDELSLFDSRETDKGKICNDSILWGQSLTSHLPNQIASDSHASSSDVYDEFTNTSVVPLHPILQSSCFTEDTDDDRQDSNFMVKEDVDAGCNFTLQETKTKSACSKIMNMPARACETRLEDNYSLTLEGMKGSMDHNPSSLCVNNSIIGNTFPMCCTQHQSSTSDSNNDKNFKGDCILPDREPAQNISKSLRSDGLTSICRTSQYESESKFVDGNRDANSCLFNCMLGEVTALDCEAHSYEKDNPTIVGIHNSTLQNSKETDQQNCASEVLFSKVSANALEVKRWIPSDLLSMKVNEKHQNLSPQKKCTLADMDPGSGSMHQSQNVVESGMPEVGGSDSIFESWKSVEIAIPADGDMSFNIENQHFDMKNEVFNPAGSFPLSVDQESSITVIQNCDLSDSYSINMHHQECLILQKTNTVKAFSESMDVNSSEGMFSGDHQLEDGPPVGQSTCCSNGSSSQNELYGSLNGTVSNGSDSYGVCSECLLSHDICLANGCKHLPLTLKDAVLIDDGYSKDTIHTFAAQEVHHTKVKNQECADLTATDNEQIANGSLLHASKTERCDLESEVEIRGDLSKLCLAIPYMGNRHQKMPEKAAFESGYALEFVFADDSIHCNHVPSSSSIEFEDPSLPTLRNIQVHGLSVNPEKDVTANGSMDMEAKGKENSPRISNSSDERGTEPQSRLSMKILLKSVAGGMTLFGALFILLHIRKRRRGEEKVGVKKLTEGERHKMNAPPKVLKARQDKPLAGNRSMVYPGDRLKFKD